jgi:NhaP-type Na+/H+ or K+/H+ antiporter
MVLAVDAPLQDELAVFGLVLVGGALLAGIARRSFLSLTAGFVIAGFLVGDGGLGILHIDPRSDGVTGLTILALVVILFRDGLEVDEEMLQKAWHLPLRKLVLAMPLTCILVAVATHTVTDLGWTQSLLLGALLSPTDPVLSSSVVNNPRVPRLVRHSLNLESGLNDGLALPAVLAFTFALSADSDFVWWKFVLQDVSIGLVTGVVVAFAASRLMPHAGASDEGVVAHQKALFALGVAFTCYGVAALPPEGNGLIATFVGGITLGILRPDIGECFHGRSEDLVELVKLAVFVVFGSLFTFGELFQDGWAAVAVVVFMLLVARPVSVFTALAGARVSNLEKGFMAWFGPKGVATMAFSLFVLSAAIPDAERIANLAALAVFTSIIAHGLTDTPGAEWLGRRYEMMQARTAA